MSAPFQARSGKAAYTPALPPHAEWLLLATEPPPLVPIPTSNPNSHFLSTFVETPRKERLNAVTPFEELPRTWPEYTTLYASGGIDIQTPPLPPLLVFSSALNTPSPFDNGVFFSPLHRTQEASRQHHLSRLDLLGESNFDFSGSSIRDDESLHAILERAKKTFGVKRVGISILKQYEQVFLAEDGAGEGTGVLTRAKTYCGHTILSDEGLIVLDSKNDWRFKNNANLTRFYAGVPFKIRPTQQHHSASPIAIGTLCIFDDVPRKGFDDSSRSNLRCLATEVGKEVEFWIARERFESPYSPSSLDSSAFSVPRPLAVTKKNSILPERSLPFPSRPIARSPSTSSPSSFDSDSSLRGSPSIASSRTSISSFSSGGSSPKRVSFLDSPPPPPFAGANNLLLEPSRDTEELADVPASLGSSLPSVAVPTTCPTRPPRSPFRNYTPTLTTRTTLSNQFFNLAVQTLGEGLSLSLAYLVLVTTTPNETISPLAHYAPGSSLVPKFDFDIHKEALDGKRGLIYTNPNRTELDPEEFAHGVMIALDWCDRKGGGIIIGGFTKDIEKMAFTKDELNVFRYIGAKVERFLAKVALKDLRERSDARLRNVL